MLYHYKYTNFDGVQHGLCTTSSAMKLAAQIGHHHAGEVIRIYNNHNLLSVVKFEDGKYIRVLEGELVNGKSTAQVSKRASELASEPTDNPVIDA